MAETIIAAHTEVRPLAPGLLRPAYIQWGPVIAGAVTAAALAFVLHSFAAAVGLAVSSTAPTWRDASAGLWFLSGVYFLFVAVTAYGLAGYLAGRMREPLPGTGPQETETRDGMHGLVTWAIATLITGLVITFAAPAASRLVAPAAGSSGPAASVGGESLLAYDLDRLFRAERRPEATDMNYLRSEAARILLTSSGRNGIAPDDRTYLVQITGEVTGLTPADAARRVDEVIASAHQDIQRARHASVIVAFFAGAAALVGAAVARFAAGAGGRQRDGDMAPWGTMRREAAR